MNKNRSDLPVEYALAQQVGLVEEYGRWLRAKDLWAWRFRLEEGYSPTENTWFEESRIFLPKRTLMVGGQPVQGWTSEDYKPRHDDPWESSLFPHGRDKPYEYLTAYFHVEMYESEILGQLRFLRLAGRWELSSIGCQGGNELQVTLRRRTESFVK